MNDLSQSTENATMTLSQPPLQHVIIFAPINITTREEGPLYGTFERINDSCKMLYILDNVCCNKHTEHSYFKEVGLLSHKRRNETLKFDTENWIQMYTEGNKITIKALKINNMILNCALNNTVVFLHREKPLLTSFIFSEMEDLPQIDYSNIFKLLSYLAKRKDEMCTNKPFCHVTSVIVILSTALLFIIKSILVCIDNNLIYKLMLDTKIGVHIITITRTFIESLSDITNHRYVTLRANNYFCARLLDVLLGKIIIYSLANAEPFNFLSHMQERLVLTVCGVVQWLKGNPAGFKLNRYLTVVYGHFFEFNVSIWWGFITMIKPSIRVLFSICLFLGHIGFSFQLALLSDILYLSTVHAYCIYVYAAKIYRLQISWIKQLSNVVIARKPMPEGARYPPEPYTTEELFLGTIAFTMVFFLLPTTLLYYMIFATVRLGVAITEQTLIYFRYLLTIFPVPIIFKWITDSSSFSSKVVINTSDDIQGTNTLVFVLRPSQRSFWRTINICSPFSVTPPLRISLTTTVYNILLGHLLHQF